MDYNEKVNAITRFCVYINYLIIFTGNLNCLYIPISVVLATFYIYLDP